MPPLVRPRRPGIYRVVTWLIDMVGALFVRRHYRVPPLAPGPLLVAVNHISWVDPLFTAPLMRAGRMPRRADVVVEALSLVDPPQVVGVLAARRFTGSVLDAVGAQMDELRCSSTSPGT